MTVTTEQSQLLRIGSKQSPLPTRRRPVTCARRPMQRSLVLRRMSLLLCPLCLLHAGCDALVIRWQTVRVEVTAIPSGKSVHGASLDFAPAPGPPYWPGREQEWLNRFGQHAITDSAGKASVHLKVQILKAGLVPGVLPGPDLSRDRITGKSYLIRIRNASGEETLAVKILPGTGIKGDTYCLKVLDIGMPRRRK